MDRDRVTLDAMLRSRPGEVIRNSAESIASLRPRWSEFAACRGMGADLFHPERGGNGNAAKQVCAGCQVREECLDDAMKTGFPGVWGGLSGRERKRGVGHDAA